MLRGQAVTTDTLVDQIRQSKVGNGTENYSVRGEGSSCKQETMSLRKVLRRKMYYVKRTDFY